MPVRNNASARIVAYVAAHPGCTRAELMAGVGVSDKHWAMPTYCCKAGLIHAAGPRGSTRYYPSAEMAAAAHDRIVAMVRQRRRETVRRNQIVGNLRRRMAHHAAGGRRIDTRPGRHFIALDPGVTLAPDVRITIAPPPRSRWSA